MKVGDTVYFLDPDEGTSSGWYRIASINGEVYTLSGSSEVEAYAHELTMTIIPPEEAGNN